jgi:peptide/nickel transport system permease protein
MSLGPEASIADEPPPPSVDAADERAIGEKAIAGRSLRQIAWRRLKRDRVAIAGGTVVLVLIVIAILAPLLIKLLGHPFDEYHGDRIDPTLGTPLGRFSGISKDFILGVEPVNGTSSAGSCTALKRR